MCSPHCVLAAGVPVGSDSQPFVQVKDSAPDVWSRIEEEVGWLADDIIHELALKDEVIRKDEVVIQSKDEVIRKAEDAIQAKDQAIKFMQALWIRQLITLSTDAGTSQQRVLLEQFEKGRGIRTASGRKIAWQTFLQKEKKAHSALWDALQKCCGAQPDTFATEAANMANAVNSNVHSVHFRSQHGSYSLLVSDAHSEAARCLITVVANEVAPGMLSAVPHSSCVLP